MFLDQAHLLEHCQGTIDRRQTDVRVADPDALVECFSIKVFLAVLKYLQDKAPLRREAPALFSEKPTEVILLHCPDLATYCN
jgi:hypothetical protein